MAESGLADIVRSAGYGCTPATFRYCARPTSVTDAKGALTEMSYSADHGGLLTETGPAPAPGAPQPQTRHDYAQRFAWVSNGAGDYVQAAAPVWVRSATSSCRTLIEEIVSSQSFADGSGYNYGYDETPFVTGHVSSIAGGSFTDNLGNVTTLRLV